jgi:hypothetical protein
MNGSPQNTGGKGETNMSTFKIDSDNNIVALAGLLAGADNLQSFSSAKELAKLTEEWPVSRLVETWNSFAGVAPFVLGLSETIQIPVELGRSRVQAAECKKDREEALIRRVQARDEVAFRQLVEQHQSKVFSTTRAVPLEDHRWCALVASAALSNSVSRASISSSSIAFAACPSTLSAQRALVEAGTFWSTMSFSSVVVAALEACWSRAIDCPYPVCASVSRIGF